MRIAVAANKIFIAVRRRIPACILHKRIITSQIHCHRSAANRAFRYQFRGDFRICLLFYHSFDYFFIIEEINSTQNKDARIQSLQPFVKNGYIKFSKKHKTLLKQMTEYPMGKNDDAPDGLQMAVKLALDVKIGRRVDYRSVIARALDFRRGAY